MSYSGAGAPTYAPIYLRYVQAGIRIVSTRPKRLEHDASYLVVPWARLVKLEKVSNLSMQQLLHVGDPRRGCRQYCGIDSTAGHFDLLLEASVSLRGWSPGANARSRGRSRSLIHGIGVMARL